MAQINLNGDTSGSIALVAPTVAGTNTITLPAQTGTLETLGVGTSVASTSGTSITFTGIPSWAKRITVIFNGVSTSGTSNILIQLGSGSITTTGYSSAAASAGGTNQAQNSSSTAGLIVTANTQSTNTTYGLVTINNISGNTWVSAGTLNPNGTFIQTSGGGIALGGVLDRVAITMVNGTDAFDAGSINIMWEG